MKEKGNIVVNNVQEQSAYLQDTGVADVYAVAFLEPIVGYSAGLKVTFKSANGNTTASTLNVNSLGPKDIRKDVVTPLVSGDILASQIITVVYDGTNFQMISGSPGASGLSGYSGNLPGTSGYSGYSGSGYSGYSGSGVSGYSAYSGSSGYSGYSAISGYSGYTADPSLYWSKLGDTGTTPGTNFLGTLDNVGLMFKCNNVQAGYINLIRNNTSLGYESLLNNNLGQGNVAFGYQAAKGQLNATGAVAIGFQALMTNISNQPFTAVGYQAMMTLNGGTANTALGYQALRLVLNTSGNTAVGHAALANNIQNYNTAMGDFAMYQNTGGYRNTAYGHRALYNNTTGTHNTSIGCYDVSGDQLLTTGIKNTNVGYNSLKATNGDENTAIGLGAVHGNLLFSNAFSRNTGVGLESLYYLTSGNDNVALGKWAGYSGSTGSNNIHLGNYAGMFNSTVSNQLFINSLNRGSYANDQTQSPIYAQQHATVSSQNIYLNGNIFNPYLTNLATQDRLVGIRNSTGQLGNVTLGGGLTLVAGVLDTVAPPVLTQNLYTTVDEAVNNSTTLVNSSELIASLEAGRTYRIEANLYFDTIGSGGVRIALDGSSVNSLYTVQSTLNSSNSMLSLRFAMQGDTAQYISGGSNPLIQIVGTVTTTSDGDLTIQFAQQSPFPIDVTLLAGSTLTLTRI